MPIARLVSIPAITAALIVSSSVSAEIPPHEARLTVDRYQDLRRQCNLSESSVERRQCYRELSIGTDAYKKSKHVLRGLSPNL